MASRHRHQTLDLTGMLKEPAGPDAVLFAESSGQIAECYQGVVWKAYLHSLPTAVKVYKNNGNFEETRRAFGKEVAILHNTNACPFTIQCLGWFSYGMHLGVVLEYAECGTLYNLMCVRNEISIGKDLANRILHQICVALNYLHNMFADQRTIHKDIKSENVLLTGELRAKLSDFAGSQIQSLTVDCNDPVLENSERNIITVEYAAPEVLQNPGNKIRSSADMHSFGVICWEMHHRRRAYGQYTGHRKACKDAIVRGEILEVDCGLDNINDSLGVLIQWCLGTSRNRLGPNDRPSAKTLINAWHDLLPYKVNETMTQAGEVASRLKDENTAVPRNLTDLMTAMGLYDERYHKTKDNRAQQGVSVHHSVRSEITPVRLWNLTAQYFLNGRFQINASSRNESGGNFFTRNLRKLSKKRSPIVAVLGDEGVGKHWMVNLHFRGDYFANSKHSKKTVDIAPKKTCEVVFKIGLSEKDKRVGAIIYCFAVDNYVSFSSLLSYWSKEVEKRFPGMNIPCLVVGMKGDLRRGFDTAPQHACEAAATALGADKYHECSSRNGKNIKEVINLAAQLALTTHA